MTDTVNTFTDPDKCIDFITDLEVENVFMTSSGILSQITIPTIQDIPQISFIYIFDEYKDQHEQWTQQFPKIRGVFTETIPIYEALEKLLANVTKTPFQ